MDSVYQSYLEYLPREIILKKYGKIESIFEIEDDLNQTLRPIYYGAFRSEIENIWKKRNLKIDDILNDLKAFNIVEDLAFFQSSKANKFLGNFGENYCFVRQNLSFNQIIYFQFGIDITKKETKKFVGQLLKIAIEKDFIFLGSNLKTFDPTVENIDNYFRNSPAYKIIKNEEEFLVNVEKGIEKMDVPF